MENNEVVMTETKKKSSLVKKLALVGVAVALLLIYLFVPAGITIIVLIIIKLYYFIFRVKTITPEEKRAMETARREMA